MNLINNNEVTTDDANFATRAYGLDVGEIEGEPTKNMPTQVVNNIVEIPEELHQVQQDLTVSMDRLAVNSLKFLSTIYCYLYYRTSQYVTKPVTFVNKG